MSKENTDNTESPVADTPVETPVETEVDVPAEETSETVDVAGLLNIIAELTAQNEALSAKIVQPIEFPDFQDSLKRMKEQKMSLIDMQNAILSSLVLKFQLEGYKMASNTATSFTSNGRESQNGISHKAQYSLNSLQAVRMMPSNVMEWLTENDACAFIFGDTSWLSADELASKKANVNTSTGWQGF